MTSLREPRPDLQDAAPFRIFDGVGSTRIESFALHDIGTDLLSLDLSNEENAKQIIYRAKLGDMAFVSYKPAGGSSSPLALYFVPEYPNNDLGQMGRFATYLARPIFGSRQQDLAELKLEDPTMRIVNWDDGVAMLEKHRTPANSKTIDRILEIDRLVKADTSKLTNAEMREYIGPATGARFTVSPFLLGDAATLGRLPPRKASCECG